jgi:ABC-type lipoprotein release transport system permease subunit
MNSRAIVGRSLRHYWRTNLAVVAGVAVAVGVLAGALLVGDSVTASLRRLALERLGEASHVISSEHFFREQLAADLATNEKFKENFRAAAPLIALEGAVTHEKSKRRAAGVAVYGVDARFFAFHEARGIAPPADREILLSEALAAEFAAQPGDAILLRIRNPSEVPIDTLHARKDELGRTLRFSLRSTLAANEMGEFSLRPTQGAVRAVFVPLARLQEELEQLGTANTILVSQNPNTGDSPQLAASLQFALKLTFALEDLDLQIQMVNQNTAVLRSDQILLPDGVVDSAKKALGVLADLTPENVTVEGGGSFTYLATSIHFAQKEIPYSLVSAVEYAALGKLFAKISSPEGLEPTKETSATYPMLLSDWAARDLGAKPGDPISLDYLVWEEGGHLVTRSAQFVVRFIYPLDWVARDKSLRPEFPGITESPNMSDWNPPFPVDLKRIRAKDEDYWHKYRTTPKALIPLEVGQKLWGSRYGKLTSFKVIWQDKKDHADWVKREYSAYLRHFLDPTRAGFTVAAVRAESLAASQGEVNFGEYFVYFSFFLVVSAVLLAALFFRLGVEQRLKEIGLLRAVGFTPRGIRRLFTEQGLLLAAAGAVLGLLGAVGYAALMIHGLRTWWVDAVGTTLLTLDVRPLSLLAGAAGGAATATLAIALALRALRRASPRSLLHGEMEESHEEGEPRGAGRGALYAGLAATLGAAALLGAALAKLLNVVAGFFGAGALLLAALMCFAWRWLAQPESARREEKDDAGAQSKRRTAEKSNHTLAWLGVRNATWRPGRSLLCIALVASATFILVAVDAFRRTGAGDAADPRSGTGGFALLGESLLPVPYDPNAAENLRHLNLGEEEVAALAGVKFFPLRLRPGDDASCLNLYQPRNPKILGVPEPLLAAGRFSFTESLAASEAERQNPWGLLSSEPQDGAVPAIVDANSLTYVFQRRVGDELVMNTVTDPATGQPLRLKLVAALRDSIFQSEVLISEKQFLRLFPYVPGFRAFLMDAPANRANEVSATLEEGLADFGFDAQAAGERLATFHRVENTYISVFQMLGGLGLLLGTLGLAAVLLRNVFERRRELALLRAVGFRPRDLAWTVLAENALLLALGLAAGVLSAALAIAPALAGRGGALPATSLLVLLAAVLVAGLAASLAAVRAVVKSNLLAALRAE